MQKLQKPIMTCKCIKWEGSSREGVLHLLQGKKKVKATATHTTERKVAQMRLQEFCDQFRGAWSTSISISPEKWNVM